VHGTERIRAHAADSGRAVLKVGPTVLKVGPTVRTSRSLERAPRGLDPLAAQRPHLELYIRWMQEIGRLRPSAVSRRFLAAAGSYRTCVLDGVLPHSPAEHVRRPSVPAESPTLGFTHLPFEALLTAARESANPCDFAVVAMLGLLGLRIFDATVRTSPTSARSTATGPAGARQGHQDRPGPASRPRSAGPSTGRQPPGPAGRAR